MGLATGLVAVAALTGALRDVEWRVSGGGASRRVVVVDDPGSGATLNGVAARRGDEGAGQVAAQGQGLGGHPLASLLGGAALLPGTEELLLGDHGQAFQGKREALGESRDPDLDATRLRPFPARLRLSRETGLEAVLAQKGPQSLHTGEGGGGEHHAPALLAPLPELVHQGYQGVAAGARVADPDRQLLVSSGLDLEDLALRRSTRNGELLETHGTPIGDGSLECLGRDQELLG